MNHERQGFHISHVYSVWQDLSRHSMFNLVTLTLKFDPLFKNFNFAIGHNLWTMRDRTFIFQMLVHCDKTFHIIHNFWPNVVDLEVWHTF